MILLAKYFIFKNKCKKTIPNLEAFKFYIKNRLTVEKEISLLKDKLKRVSTKLGNCFTYFRITQNL